MASLRPVQLLLCVVYLTQTSVYAANQTCGCPGASNEGLFTDMPCQECPDGHYRSCDRGSYYAHHPTMCIYASRQDYTHDDARLMCMKRDVSGFPAFVADPEESYHVSHYVWNSLKNGVEGNETYFWLGGTLKHIIHKNQTLLSFKYRDYEVNVTKELWPTDMNKALLENRTCLAGHTEKHTTLHARHCDEKLPAVCYNYRQRPMRLGSCKQDPGKDWTFFQGKCYYVHSARSEQDKKTYFDAQRECAAMNSILATVTDEATFKKTLELATGFEKIVDLDDATWIGLQLSAMGYGGVYYYPNGTTRNFKKVAEYPTEENISLVHPLPADQVEGWWQDGTPYDAVALAPFWVVDTEQDGANNQPNEVRVGKGSDAHDGCNERKIRDSDRHLCELDPFQHCTQIFPGGTNEVVSTTCTTSCAFFANKWNDRWCYFPQRGYICQRDAVSAKDPQRMNDEL